MGAPVPEQETAELPAELSYLYEAYRQLKFSRIPSEDAFLLVPRDPVQYTELESFNRLSGLDLEPWEIDAMLSIDSIFERSRGA